MFFNKFFKESNQSAHLKKFAKKGNYDYETSDRLMKTLRMGYGHANQDGLGYDVEHEPIIEDCLPNGFYKTR